MSNMDEQLIQSNKISTKLPKLTFPKIFRIKSASKQKINSNNRQLDRISDHKSQNSKNKNTNTQQAYNSCDKNKFKYDQRSNSLKNRSNANPNTNTNHYINKISITNKLKTSHSKAQICKYTEYCTNNTQSDSQQSQQGMVNDGYNKINVKNNMNNLQAIQKQHEMNILNLQHIAMMFDPNKLLKLGTNIHMNNNKISQNQYGQQCQQLQGTKKQTQNNVHWNVLQQNILKQAKSKSKSKNNKYNNRLNSHIFQTKPYKNRNKLLQTNINPTINQNIIAYPNINTQPNNSHNTHTHNIHNIHNIHTTKSKINKNNYNSYNNKFYNQQQQQYWNKVNQSLILTNCKTIQNQISKDLRQIYQTLVTE